MRGTPDSVAASSNCSSVTGKPVNIRKATLNSSSEFYVTHYNLLHGLSLLHMYSFFDINEPPSGIKCKCFLPNLEV